MFRQAFCETLELISDRVFAWWFVLLMGLWVMFIFLLSFWAIGPVSWMTVASHITISTTVVAFTFLCAGIIYIVRLIHCAKRMLTWS